MERVELPQSRPVLWPLRPIDTAAVRDEQLTDGRRRITIEHQPLEGVTPAMLAWWYGHIPGRMEYAGGTYPRYLVWHPLDHISYTATNLLPDRSVGVGSRLRIAEAFQREPKYLTQIDVRVRHLSEREATIDKRLLGMTALELANSFEPVGSGTRYTTTMTIGTEKAIGRLGLNRILTSRILPGNVAMHWAQHHVEEVGNLVNFLPQLYATETARAEH